MSAAIELAPEPQSVKEARDWVVAELGALGRDDLVDAAELGVSELVTNAILHAEPPIVVRVGGTPTHPRVEVHDHSVAPPRLRDMTDDERLLATVGRGLGIVSMFSSTWGAEVSPSGKVVWFEPVAEPMLEDEPTGDPHGDVFDLTEEIGRRLESAGEAVERITVRFIGMPVKVFAHHRSWYEEVRRELRLLALTHGSDYPVAQEVSELTLQVEQERRQASGIEVLERAMVEGADRVDLEYVVPASAAETMSRLGELFRQVDVFCREQLLLTLAPTPQMLALRVWYLGEFGRQARGEEPLPWRGSYDVQEPDR